MHVLRLLYSLFPDTSFHINHQDLTSVHAKSHGVNFFSPKKVLTYAQQSKEMANVEQDKLAKRIQEFRTQAELDSLRASSAIEPSVITDGVHAAGTDSYKSIEAIMQSTKSGQVIGYNVLSIFLLQFLFFVLLESFN